MAKIVRDQKNKTEVTNAGDQSQKLEKPEISFCMPGGERKHFENYFDETFGSAPQSGGSSMLQQSVANAFAAALGMAVLATPMNFSIAYANENVNMQQPTEIVRSA